MTLRIRPASESDLPKLKKFYDANGFAFDFPSLEGSIDARVIEDEAGDIICAVFATPIVELTLVMDKNRHPALKLAAIRKFHSLFGLLRDKGYREALASIPPEIELPYGKRLRALGWREKWTSYVMKL